MKLLRLVGAAAAGGCLGAGLRAWLTESLSADPGGALVVTLAINVVGCALLAALPALAVVRRHHTWSVFLGTGVLGGFTTMSTAVALPVAALSPALALGYLAVTLLAALLAVRVVNLLVPGAAAGAPIVDRDA